MSLAGELDLTLAPGVQSSDLLGDTFKLFDWTGVSFAGQFNVVGDPHWDTSDLYTTGEVSYVAPEPSTMILLGVGVVGLLAAVWRRRKRMLAVR